MPCPRKSLPAFRTTSSPSPIPAAARSSYPLINVVVISVCAVLSGADDFLAIAAFGRSKRAWLSRFLDLESGIPSHDRFNAILAAIDPEEFEQCLLSWMLAIHEVTEGQVIAIDGKTLRGSYDKARGKAAIHMVSAWGTANQISLGQGVVDEKSNEITAIPKLRRVLEISGALVTIDAMGCQPKIAQEIVSGIENRLHWQLDVTFQEDRCRVRCGYAAVNLSLLRRTVLSVLKNATREQVGIKNKRLKAAWEGSSQIATSELDSSCVESGRAVCSSSHQSVVGSFSPRRSYGQRPRRLPLWNGRQFQYSRLRSSIG